MLPLLQPQTTLFLKPHYDVTVRPGLSGLSVRVQVVRPPLQWPVSAAVRAN